MKKILDLGFGRRTLYELFSATQMSSRLQYGLAQLGEGYSVDHVSWEPFNMKGHLQNNLKALMPCDVVFLTYLYLQPVLLLAILRRLGFFRGRKLIAISHVALKPGKDDMETSFLRFVYGGFSKILFHSQLNMEESIQHGLVKPERCEFLQWGDDLGYIDSHLQITQGDTFLSTGRECRDFPILVTAFGKTPYAKLNLYTNKVNYGNDYSYLESEQGKYPNVNIQFVEKSTDTTRFLAHETASCLCVVIPLVKSELYYCVGLTSVVEAMALAKPIISTRNPYSPVDLEKEGIGFFVDDEQSWIKAIDYLATHPDEAAAMGRKARKLAKERFNINQCSKQIERLFNE